MNCSYFEIILLFYVEFVVLLLPVFRSFSCFVWDLPCIFVATCQCEITCCKLGGHISGAAAVRKQQQQWRQESDTENMKV